MDKVAYYEEMILSDVLEKEARSQASYTKRDQYLRELDRERTKKLKREGLLETPEMKHRRHVFQGVGAGAGALVGAGAGAIRAKYISKKKGETKEEARERMRNNVLGGALLGAGAGTAVGGVTGFDKGLYERLKAANKKREQALWQNFGIK